MRLLHQILIPEAITITCCSVFPESWATLFLLAWDSARSSGFSLSSANSQNNQQPLTGPVSVNDREMKLFFFWEDEFYDQLDPDKIHTESSWVWLIIWKKLTASRWPLNISILKKWESKVHDSAHSTERVIWPTSHVREINLSNYQGLVIWQNQVLADICWFGMIDMKSTHSSSMVEDRTHTTNYHVQENMNKSPQLCNRCFFSQFLCAVYCP